MDKKKIVSVTHMLAVILIQLTLLSFFPSPLLILLMKHV